MVFRILTFALALGFIFVAGVAEANSRFVCFSINKNPQGQRGLVRVTSGGLFSRGKVAVNPVNDNGIPVGEADIYFVENIRSSDGLISIVSKANATYPPTPGYFKLSAIHIDINTMMGTWATGVRYPNDPNDNYHVYIDIDCRESFNPAVEGYFGDLE